MYSCLACFVKLSPNALILISVICYRNHKIQIYMQMHWHMQHVEYLVMFLWKILFKSSHVSIFVYVIAPIFECQDFISHTPLCYIIFFFKLMQCLMKKVPSLCVHYLWNTSSEWFYFLRNVLSEMKSRCVSHNKDNHCF